MRRCSLSGNTWHGATPSCQAKQVTAQGYFGKSIWQNRVPETAAIDKSGANLAALHAVNVRHNTPTKICQIKYLTT